MALVSLYQAGTAVLVVVAILEALFYVWNRKRAREEARREGALHDLEAGQRLLRVAEKRHLRGGYEASVRIAERARTILMEARRRAVETGDADTEADVRAVLERCAVLMEKSAAGFREAGKAPERKPESRPAPRRFSRLEKLLDECESLGRKADEAHASGDFAGALEQYRTVRSRLNEARRAAVEAGSMSYVKLIEKEMARVQRGITSANAWVLDGRPVFETPRRGEVKGVISPTFRREDGSHEPRPRGPENR
jgi:hypothetical protein